MKSLVLASFFSSAVLATAALAQVKSVAVANQPNQSTTQTTNSAQPQAANRRSRVLSPEFRKTSSTPRLVTAGKIRGQAKADFPNNLGAGRANDSNQPGNTAAESSKKIEPNSSAAINAPTQLYRVGVRDVLDIQLDELAGKGSTLFTVQLAGMLDYPLAGSPFPVAGMTTTEIASVLRQRIKIFDKPTIAVTVRDYASHIVSISGLIAAPGTKVLRREAVPLYTLLAEASVLPEASRAIITRQGRFPIVADLKDANMSATLIIAGDAIRVAGPPADPTEFYFVSGEIISPGQKPFHAGLTLTQAVIASGGTNANAGSRVKVSRQGTDGRLITEEYNLRKIQAGKMPDPRLQAGDRIKVTSN